MPMGRMFRAYTAAPKKKPLFQPTSKVVQVAVKERKLEKRIRKIEKLIDTQPMYSDLYFSNQIVAPVSYYDLSAISEQSVVTGSWDNIRDDNRVKLQRLAVDYQITANYGGAYTSSAVRVIIFKWDDNTLPQDTDILDNNQTSITYLSHYNLLDKTRYKIMYDRMHVISSSTTVSAGQPNKVIRKINLPCAWDCYFGGTSSTSGKGGRVFMFVFAEDGSLYSPTITFHSRLTFSD